MVYLAHGDAMCLTKGRNIFFKHIEKAFYLRSTDINYVIYTVSL
jgi:hypothetical protein